MAALISLNNIQVQFDDRIALQDVSLTINPKQILTLIGPNGAGKSTLVKVMLGLLKPDSGDITRAPKLKVGYVPQKLKLNETLPLTVDRFLKLAGRYSKAERTQTLERVGAAHLSANNMHKLSGGETQRVLLARAMLKKPDLLVLDEPAQGVDVQGQIELYQLIKQVRDELSCGVFMVSHDLHLVMAQTDEVICLNHHVCCHGSPDSISQHPSYLQLFGQEAKGTLAVYQHHHHHQHDISGEAIDQCPNQNCTQHPHHDKSLDS